MNVQEHRHGLWSVLPGTQRWKAVVLWVVLTAGAAYLFFFEPGRTGIFPGCPFRAITGFTCPGCGSTRALHQLLHGRLLAALELNPLLVLAVPFLLIMLLLYTRSAFTGKPLPQISMPRSLAWALTALVICFWIFRNTPGYPFPV